jgi:hypothetical protein
MSGKSFAGLMVAVTLCAAPFIYYSDGNTTGYSSSLDTKVYGAMTDDSSQNAKLYSIQKLGLSATRESILTSTYKGTAGRLQFWNTNNIKMFLNINSYQQGTGKGFQSPDTFVPIMLDIANKYKPYWVFIENEELNNSYHEGDLFNDYTKLIKAAIDSGHAHNLKISNGGITSNKIVKLTYRWLWKTNDSAASYFLKNCVPVDDTLWLSNYMTDKKQEILLSEQEALLRWYSNSKIDAVNIHLYLPFKNRTKGTISAKGNGIVGLNYVIDYLNSVLDGKKIISNEIGFVENNTDLSYNTFKFLDSAGIECCFYGSKGAKRFVRERELTKLGNGIFNYTP